MGCNSMPFQKESFRWVEPLNWKQSKEGRRCWSHVTGCGRRMQLLQRFQWEFIAYCRIQWNYCWEQQEENSLALGIFPLDRMSALMDLWEDHIVVPSTKLMTRNWTSSTAFGRQASNLSKYGVDAWHGRVRTDRWRTKALVLASTKIITLIWTRLDSTYQAKQIKSNCGPCFKPKYQIATSY